MLSDAEIIEVWDALNDVRDTFAAPIRLMLLLGVRPSEIAGMRWSELSGLDSDEPWWTIPPERLKSDREHLVPLPPLAVEIILSIAKRGSLDLVFGCTGKPLSGWSQAKSRIDERINAQRKLAKLPAMSPWVLHDVRCTARSNFSRLGVRAEIRRAILGHAQPGMRMDGVYDAWGYYQEKRDALTKWERLVRKILGVRAVGRY